MQIALVNPRKRGGKKRRARRGKVARSASRSTARRTYRVAKRAMRSRRRSSAARRRNPISLGGLKNRLVPALWGGAGGVLTDVGFRMLPLPASLSILKGSLAPVTKVGVALLVSKVAGMFLGSKRADEMLTGSLAIIGYGLLNDVALKYLPVVGAPGVSGSYDFAGMGYVSPGSIVRQPGAMLPSGGMAEYVNGVGEYVSGGDYDFA